MNIEWNIERFEEVASTQDILKNSSADSEGRVVVADRQTQGRGRYARQWFDGEGNLMFSFALEPRCEARFIGQLSLIIGLAVHNALQGFIDTPEKLMLKWPNDVLLRGEKCCGILIESSLSSSGLIDKLFVGIGINVLQAPDDMGVALSRYSSSSLMPSDVLQAVLGQVESLYARFQNGEAEALLHEWSAYAHEIGQPIEVKPHEGVLKGRYDGLDELGNLYLRLEDESRKTISAADIFLL